MNPPLIIAPKLSPQNFTWEKYLSQARYAVTDLVNTTNYHHAAYKLNPGVKMIGYCDASKIPVRQRPGQIAIMVEKNGDEVWFHALHLPENS